MKAVTVTGVGLVIAAAGFWLLAPAAIKDRLVGLATFNTDERQCFNLYKEHLNDPESAYLEKSFVWTKEWEAKYRGVNPDPIYKKYDSVLKVQIRAKNRMGGYVDQWVQCPLLNGRFDRHTTEMYRIDEMTKQLRK